MGYVLTLIIEVSFVHVKVKTTPPVFVVTRIDDIV